MTKARQKITRTTIKTLAPKDKAYVIWDSEVSGFGVRVQPGGSISYVAVHRLQGARNASWIVLGKIQELTPEVARDRARAAIVAAREGRHVGSEARERSEALKARRKQPQGLQVSEAVDRYLRAISSEVSERTGRKRAASTIKAEGLWLRGLEETFGKVPLEDVTGDLIKQVLASTPAASKRNVGGSMTRFFTWSTESGYVKANPCSTVRRPRAPASRTRTPSLEEVRRILKAVDDLVRDGSWTDVQGDCVKMLLLTGQRRAEICEVRWEDIRLSEALWVQHPERNKSAREHEVPLSHTLMDLLQKTHAAQGKPETGRVFPAVRSGGSMNPWMSDAMEWIRESTGINFVWHDIRRSMVTVMADHDISIDTADAVLNHARSATVQGVAAVYQRSKLLKQKRFALDLWSGLLTREDGASNVITIGSRS